MQNLFIVALVLIILWIVWSRRSRCTYDRPPPAGCNPEPIAKSESCAAKYPDFPKDGLWADSTKKYCCK